MKDSQLSGVEAEHAAKYIKVNNERFSTREEVIANLV